MRCGSDGPLLVRSLIHDFTSLSIHAVACFPIRWLLGNVPSRIIFQMVVLPSGTMVLNSLNLMNRIGADVGVGVVICNARIILFLSVRSRSFVERNHC